MSSLLRTLLGISQTDGDYRDCFRGTELFHFLTRRALSGLQEGSNKFTLATYDHARESFEPLAFRHFGFGGQPIGEQAKLISTDLSAADTGQQVIEQARRQALTANSRHG